ncbi:EamA family transporter [Rhodococcus sp. HNM0563]|uniref:DMT family transporter n=1 Tax=unclassified Rhodococcus (in: high G+C Gram-positive bacteria) TaxID=192944 RepID=UPI00146EBD80|nr:MULTISPECIES: EamA family transporter [unclassified Rhodococcus (in: high G+C Gram-positive bacteria)]NLU60929.1 EamA family transporter [Rhodococcus sp. HNM0563]
MLALVAAVGYGVSDFLGGVASRRATALSFVVASYPLSLVIVLVIAPIAGGDVTAESLIWGAASGLFGGFAVWWFYRALASGPMSVVSPVTALLVAGIPVLAGLVTGERPGPLAGVGIVVALIAVVLVSRESKETVGGDEHPAFTLRVAGLTAAGGVAFALTFISLDQVPDGTGLWPLVFQRLSATAVVWAVAVAVRQFTGPPRLLYRHVVAVALLDVVSNAAMMFAFQGGMLSLVSVVGALYPAATVLLALVVLGERLGRGQYTGMILACLSVAMITFGT